MTKSNCYCDDRQIDTRGSLLHHCDQPRKSIGGGTRFKYKCPYQSQAAHVHTMDNIQEEPVAAACWLCEQLVLLLEKY